MNHIFSGHLQRLLYNLDSIRFSAVDIHRAITDTEGPTISEFGAHSGTSRIFQACSPPSGSGNIKDATHLTGQTVLIRILGLEINFMDAQAGQGFLDQWRSSSESEN